MERRKLECVLQSKLSLFLVKKLLINEKRICCYPFFMLDLINWLKIKICWSTMIYFILKYLYNRGIKILISCYIDFYIKFILDDKRNENLFTEKKNQNLMWILYNSMKMLKCPQLNTQSNSIEYWIKFTSTSHRGFFFCV